MLKVKSSLGEKRIVVNNILDKKYLIKTQEIFKNAKIKSVNSLEGMKLKVKENI